MNYTSLVKQIQDYAYRTDQQFLLAIPYFIQNAHSRIYRDAKDIGEQISINGKFTKDSPILEKPANWAQTLSFEYSAIEKINNDNNILLSRTYEFCRAYWPNNAIPGLPLFYADNPSIDPNNPYGSFYITPTPDKDYEYQLVYLTQPIVITANIQTNWLTQYAPDLLFYACMCDAMPYLQDDARSAAWQPLYEKALQSVNNYTKERYTDRIYTRDKV